MENKAIIPVALQICFDDLGWHNGRDLRYKGQASRSGIPRDHSLADYLIIHELGKALDQRILAPLCLGDWDKDNILRGEVGVTHDPYGWDRAATINMEQTKAFFDALEGSDYIEYAVHSTLHGKYDEEGNLIHENEYFDVGADGIKHPIPLEDFERRIRLFFEIYNSWGFKKDVRIIGSPGGVSREVSGDELHALGKVLKKYGIRYWHARWANGRAPSELIGDVRFAPISNSVMPPWNAFDVDPRYLPDAFSEDDPRPYGLVSLHWTNFIRYNPEHNLDNLPLWVDYFKRHGEKFGCMLSRGFKFSVDQQTYRELVGLSCSSGECELDLSKIFTMNIEDLSDEFYISFKKDSLPTSISGGTLSLYEEKRGFNTYKIKDFGKIVKIHTKI